MKKLVALAVLLMLPNFSYASVGSITEHNGPSAEIVRDSEKLSTERGFGVEMNDAITTSKTKLGITFLDDTVVSITEQSKLVIDDFIYDPNSSTGRLAMKVALGTVKYTSGAIAHNNRENVRLRTPTAKISVRGTDFSMTVDEIGRSLVILLPSCPDGARTEEECWVGEIEVSNSAGAVILNQAFQATVVSSDNLPPTEPKIVNVNSAMISNLLIISPPEGLDNGFDSRNNNEQKTELDQDLLEYEELAKDFLQEDLLKMSSLDINRLDGDYLDNLLDITGRGLESAMDGDPVIPTAHLFPWVQTAYNEEIIISFSERPPHIAEIQVQRDTNGISNIVQDGIEANIEYNAGPGDVIINITQTQ